MKIRPFKRLRIATVIVVGGLFAACSSTETPTWTGTIGDSAGVVVVMNPAEGIWTPETRWTVEENLRIGNVDGDSVYQFGAIGGIAVTRDGRIAVLDRQAAQLSVFTSDGQFENVIGRPGNGPGELGQGGGPLGLGRGDTLIVADLGNNGRMNWYAADGTAAGSVRPPPQGRGWPMRWQGTPTGDIAIQTRPLPAQGQARDTMDMVTLRTSALAIIDTLLTFRSGESFSINQGAQEYQWFAPEPSWVINPDGDIWFGANQGHRFLLYEPDGAVRRVVTRPGERVSVSEQDRGLFNEVLEGAWADANVPPQFLERLRSSTRYAEQLPAFAQLFVGPDESLWVQRVLRPSELTPEGLQLLRQIGGRDGLFDQLRGLKGAEWDIYDAEGRYLGVLELPARFEPIQVVDEDIYGVWWDDLDVQYVMRLRVVRPFAG
jgi:hypothetical protein